MKGGEEMKKHCNTKFHPKRKFQMKRKKAKCLLKKLLKTNPQTRAQLLGSVSHLGLMAKND